MGRLLIPSDSTNSERAVVLSTSSGSGLAADRTDFLPVKPYWIATIDFVLTGIWVLFFLCRLNPQKVPHREHPIACEKIRTTTRAIFGFPLALQSPATLIPLGHVSALVLPPLAAQKLAAFGPTLCLRSRGISLSGPNPSSSDCALRPTTHCEACVEEKKMETRKRVWIAALCLLLKHLSDAKC